MSAYQAGDETAIACSRTIGVPVAGPEVSTCVVPNVVSTSRWSGGVGQYSRAASYAAKNRRRAASLRNRPSPRDFPSSLPTEHPVSHPHTMPDQEPSRRLPIGRCALLKSVRSDLPGWPLGLVVAHDDVGLIDRASGVEVELLGG